MNPIGEVIKDRNIKLDTLDPVSRGGFTQVPNFILRAADLSIGAKMAYALFLSYAWHNDLCFPGQERLSEDMGLDRSTVTSYISELQRAGYVTVERRGQGKTNLYTLHFRVGKALTIEDASRIARRPQRSAQHPDVG